MDPAALNTLDLSDGSGIHHSYRISRLLQDSRSGLWGTGPTGPVARNGIAGRTQPHAWYGHVALSEYVRSVPCMAGNGVAMAGDIDGEDFEALVIISRHEEPDT